MIPTEARTLPISRCGVSEIIDVLHTFVEETGIPGASAAVFSADGTISSAAVGVRAVDAPQEPMTTDTAGPLYSLSKLLTMTGIAILVDQGELSFDEPITRYLPDTEQTERFSTTTLRHLLSHTSGLLPVAPSPTHPAQSYDALERWALGAGLTTGRLSLPEQGVFGYSNVGVALAGYVAQRVAQEPFAYAMRDLLFGPARMRRATFDPLVAMTGPITQQHMQDKGRLWVRRRFDLPAEFMPCTGAFGSVTDLARLGMVLLGMDSVRPLLSERLRRDILHPTVDVGLDIERIHGLAVAQWPRYGGMACIGHDGHWSGCWLRLAIIPELRIGAAWLDNRDFDRGLRGIRTSSIDQLLHLAGAGSRDAARAYVPNDLPSVAVASGTYARPAGRPIEITAENDALVATDGPRTARYSHLSGRVFVADESKDLMGYVPWEPEIHTDRSALCLVGPPKSPTHLLLNGVPYRRVR
ncbi:hypothetical protein GCM10009765_81970 [Fodinicola feengrottensis]|uniref:Beta-lactamase-related domain-containing protein n=1 Tax=Fodinicola feengrottensis TaxID=435914 RepID=A0ABP4VB80_9ACTN